MKRYHAFLVFVLCVFGLMNPVEAGFRYVALGDSYTIGEGVGPQKAWPFVMAERLKSEGVDIHLAANLAASGWTVQDVIDGQLPQMPRQYPNVITVMIGANDIARNTPPETFAERFSVLLDRLHQDLPEGGQLIVVNIPDFSLTPWARKHNVNFRPRIEAFNRIIAQAARQRRLPLVDVYPSSQKMGLDESLLSADGLHPSASGYAMWANDVYQIMGPLLGNQN